MDVENWTRFHAERQCTTLVVVINDVNCLFWFVATGTKIYS